MLYEFTDGLNAWGRYAIMDPVDSDGNPIPSEYDLGQVKIQLTREIFAQKETSGGGAAAEGMEGWEAKVTPEGRIFYINQGLDITQWNHPAMNDQALPHGWEHAIDAQGRKYYVDTESGKPGKSIFCFNRKGDRETKGVRARDGKKGVSLTGGTALQMGQAPNLFLILCWRATIARSRRKSHFSIHEPGRESSCKGHST